MTRTGRRPGNPNPTHKLTKDTANINPKGINQYTALPPELRSLRALTREEHIKVVTTLLGMNKDQLNELIKNPEANIHELLAASCIYFAITKGDIYVYEKIMDRIIGRVPVAIDHSGSIVNTNITLNEKEQKTIREIGAFIARSKDSTK